MTVMLPTLSSNGWLVPVDQPLLVANTVMAHFFCSDYSQTHIYKDRVFSFSYIMQENKTDVPATIASMQESLESLLTLYFDEASVEIKEYPEVFSGAATLKLYAEFKTGGSIYKLSKAISMVGDGPYQKVVSINNYGE